MISGQICPEDILAIKFFSYNGPSYKRSTIVIYDFSVILTEYLYRIWLGNCDLQLQKILRFSAVVDVVRIFCRKSRFSESKKI